MPEFPTVCSISPPLAFLRDEQASAYTQAPTRSVLALARCLLFMQSPLRIEKLLSVCLFTVSPALSRQCCACRHPLPGSGCSPPLHARWPAPRRSRCRPHSPDNCTHDTAGVAKPDQCTAIYLHLDIAACQRLRDTLFISVAQPDIAKMPSLHAALLRSRSDLGFAALPSSGCNVRAHSPARHS